MLTKQAKRWKIRAGTVRKYSRRQGLNTTSLYRPYPRWTMGIPSDLLSFYAAAEP